MMKAAARALTTMGLVMLVMAVLVRLVSMNEADTVGDDLAIMSSFTVFALGALYTRFGPG